MPTVSELMAKNISNAQANIQAWGNVIYNVKAHGAYGDGKTDDTNVIQECIDKASESGGGVVFFPSGTYMVRGLTLKDYVLLEGSGKNVSIIKLIDGSNKHVIQAGDYDINADGVNKNEPIGCRTGGLRSITVDGNKQNQSESKHGLAYYGIDMYLEDVEFKNAKGINLATESPGSTYSVVVGQNLQSSIRHIECHDGGFGNIYYNGQSDSTLIDILCYETGGTGAGQYNFRSGTKAMGIRVFGMHCWGVSDYGLINEASTAGFTNCHIESASVAKVWIKASTYFDGRVYQAGVESNGAPGFLIEPGVGFNNIRSTLSNCDYAVKFVGTDGGNSLYDLQLYSPNPMADLFSGTLSQTNFVRARLTGGNTKSVFQTPNMRQIPGSNYDFTTPGNNFRFYTDESKTFSQFAIEHNPNSETYVAATGGTTIAGPALIVRGTGNDYDLRLIPKGNGRVRFGTFVSNSDVPIVGYIEVKDSLGNIRKLAVIS